MVARGSTRVTKQDVIDRLVENNIRLLKKNADLMQSVNNLTKKTDQLVNIFKKAAEHIEKGQVNEPLADKLTDLLEQNKRIANGLLMLERFVREKEEFGSSSKKRNFEGLF